MKKKNASFQSAIKMSPDEAMQGSFNNNPEVIAKIHKSFHCKWQEVRTYIYLKKVTHLNIWLFFF